jgi:hypothetical protein
MTAAGVQNPLNPELHPTPPSATQAGSGRAAAALQLAIAVAYTGGVVVPALVTGALPASPEEATTRLWSESGSVPASLMHILGFFAATVGIAMTMVCVPLVVAAVVRGWRRSTPGGRALLIAAALLGIAFLAFSASPSGRALRGCIAD